MAHARLSARVVSLSLLTVILIACADARRIRPDDGTVPVTCGNGAVDPGEGCDDGNREDGDGCSAVCRVETCDAVSCPVGCCTLEGVCATGLQDDVCGTGGAACASCYQQGLLCDDQACRDLGACTAGQVRACGLCGIRSCDETAGAFGACDLQGTCTPGDETTLGSCGHCGTTVRTCEPNCQWGAEHCSDEGPCQPGLVETGSACGTCAVNQRTCSETCAYGDWTCIPTADCEAGEVETGATCGRCGHQERTCVGGCEWSAWACAGEGECNVGEVTTTGCTGCTSRTCSDQCMFGPCVPPVETCNGLDDDCDGVCDDGFACCRGQTTSCTTACGSQGTTTCSQQCTAGACQVPSEVCNGQDDDCDGSVDEGYRAAERSLIWSSVAAYDVGCDGSPSFGVECNHAFHAYCVSQGCPQSGFGPVENNGTDAFFVCVAGGELRTETWATLAARVAECNGVTVANSLGCWAAINRQCRDILGYLGGFGPVFTSVSGATIYCVDSGALEWTTFTELSTHHPPCDGVTQRQGNDCNAAIKRYCVSLGHTSGFGPVENQDDDAVVVCVDP